jgi:NAD(P)H dehydrogenase (quinone)
MHVLVVLTHPDQQSLTAYMAREIAVRLAPPHTVEMADLSAEGFAPAFTLEDAQAYRTAGTVPVDVQQEQERISRADAVVLVYPIYWWGLPAMLKGWIERVFSNGWAYGGSGAGDPGGTALHGKQIHLVGLGASGAGTYERHGYLSSMHAAIEHGIFEYCGAPVASSRILHEAESSARAPLSEFLYATASDILSGLARNAR